MSFITKREARAYRSRWKAVNAAELEELRRTPIAKKLLQLSALMGSVKQLGWTRAFKKEEAQVRKRWMRLRKSLHA